MLEIESKFRVEDLGLFESRLTSLGARFLAEREERDLYFNAPHRDFAQTDEAVRLRQIAENNYLTYKGPRIDPQTKSRREIEVPLGSSPTTFDDARRWLEAIGFRPVREIRKRRKVYETERGPRRILVSLDHIPGLGDFVELEILAGDDEFLAAKMDLLNLAADWHLTNSERRSYLELSLAGERSG